jgi:hypothetical protein
LTFITASCKFEPEEYCHYELKQMNDIPSGSQYNIDSIIIYKYDTSKSYNISLPDFLVNQGTITYLHDNNSINTSLKFDNGSQINSSFNCLNISSYNSYSPREFYFNGLLKIGGFEFKSLYHKATKLDIDDSHLRFYVVEMSYNSGIQKIHIGFDIKCSKK